MKTFSLMFTGISGSGKTTLSRRIFDELVSKKIVSELLDGDVLRKEWGNPFGYTREERMKNSRVVRSMIKYLNRNGVSVIVSLVAPYEEMRKGFREYIGETYIEVYVKCSYEECVRRDVKGYYKSQKEGKMKNLNGADDPFEIPQNSDIIVDTEHESIDVCAKKIMDYLRVNEYVV